MEDEKASQQCKPRGDSQTERKQWLQWALGASVGTPDPSALGDAYQALKVLRRDSGRRLSNAQEESGWGCVSVENLPPGFQIHMHRRELGALHWNPGRPTTCLGQ